MNNDLISRQDAIDALEEQLDYLRMLNKNENPTAEGKWYGVNWARNTIADLPSAEPTFGLFREMLCSECEKECAECKEKRPQGKWVAKKPYMHETFCPFCKEYTKDEVYGNFCPNCGADMRGAK